MSRSQKRTPRTTQVNKPYPGREARRAGQQGAAQQTAQPPYAAAFPEKWACFDSPAQHISPAQPSSAQSPPEPRPPSQARAPSPALSLAASPAQPSPAQPSPARPSPKAKGNNRSKLSVKTFAQNFRSKPRTQTLYNFYKTLNPKPYQGSGLQSSSSRSSSG